jgi:hypothetical protein
LPDLWSSFTILSDASDEDHGRVCLWNRVLALSGVPIAWEVFQHLFAHDGLNLPTLRDLIAIVGANVSPIEVKDYASICCQLFGQLAMRLTTTAIEPAEIEADALHHGLLLVLRAYGTPEEDLEGTTLAVKATGYSSRSR